MSSTSHPEEKNPVPEAAADPCVVCGHELWCHQVPRPAAAAWHCNGHGPVCVRFASTIRAKSEQAAEEAQQRKILRELKAAAAAEVRWPLWGSLVDYVPCPKPLSAGSFKAESPIAGAAVAAATELVDHPHPIGSKLWRAPIAEPCRATWAAFPCSLPAGHHGKHHTYDGAHSWHRVDVPPGPFDVSDTPTFAAGVEMPSNGYRGRPAPPPMVDCLKCGAVHPASMKSCEKLEKAKIPDGEKRYTLGLDDMQRARGNCKHGIWLQHHCSYCNAEKANAEKLPEPTSSGITSPTPAPLHRLGEVPQALRALASQIAFGSSKPGRTVGDWRPAYSSAQGRSKLIDKILRHALALAAGELLDGDGRPHAAAVIANTAFLLELEGTP